MYSIPHAKFFIWTALHNEKEMNNTLDEIKEGESPTLDRIVKPLRDPMGRFTDSGNPLGMPSGTPSLSRALKRRLREHPEEEEAIVDVVIKLGLIGDMRALELIWERVDGKVVEKHLVEGEMPVMIQLVPARHILEDRNEDKPLLSEGR